MHAVIRRWNAAASLIDEMERRADEVERVISGSLGFVSYCAVRSGDTLVSLTVCQDEAGTEDSTRRAAGWVRETFPDAAIKQVVPEIIAGEPFIRFGAPQRLGSGATLT
jgi:hypothetical protein